MRSDPRARYYASLGIFPTQPSEAASKRPALLAARRPASALRSPPCLRHKRSVLHTTPAREQRVSWNQNVKLYRIPSHESYTDEEWCNMWIDGDTLEYEKDRNTFEFTTDGADWRNATEEEDFQEAPDGSLVHPATAAAFRTHWNKNGMAAPLAVNFRSLLRQLPPRGWSPRPRQRKTFWLLELAMESVAKGKNAFGDRRLQSPSDMSMTSKPPRKSDRGFP